MSASRARAQTSRPARRAKGSNTSRKSAKRAHATPAESGADVSNRALSVGFLALLPLLCAYEFAYAQTGLRNGAEVVASLPLTFVVDPPTLARRIVLLCCATWAAWNVFHHDLGLARRTLRIALEGFAAALVLGPLLLVIAHALEWPTPTRVGSDPRSAPTDVAQSAFFLGGAAWEELFFRFGLQTLLLLALREIGRAWLGVERVPRVALDAIAIPLTALAFAAAHLEACTRFLWEGGEAFDAGIFTWRFLAGILLGVLFRVRGPGVAAWTHGLFNLALLAGAGPDVFL